jgi:opacity protein-like surface antigen
MTRSFVRRHLGRGACAAALAVVLAAPAQAQTPQPKPTGTAKPEAAQKPPTTPAPQPAQKPPQPARPASSPARPAGPPMFSFQAFGDVGLTGFAAKSSFDELFGSSSGATFGGGAQIAHRRGYFVRFDLSRFTATGERAFVHEGEVFKLGIPLKLTLTPIEFTAGYRFVARQRVPRPPAPRPATPRKSVASGEQPRPGSATPGPAPRRPLRRWVPYVGGGFGTMQYEETSSLATKGESESTSFSSYHVLGGVDVPIWKFIGLGVEAHYRWVPDALGADGVSKEFEDKDLGGYSFRLRLTLGR